MAEKPVAEVLAGIYTNELAKLQKYEDHENWWQEHTTPEQQAQRMAAMVEVVRTLGMFNLEVAEKDGRLMLRAISTPPARKKLSPTSVGPAKMSILDAKSYGFTGNSCIDCGSMQLVSNGTCEKCTSCGATTGCS